MEKDAPREELALCSPRAEALDIWISWDFLSTHHGHGTAKAFPPNAFSPQTPRVAFAYRTPRPRPAGTTTPPTSHYPEHHRHIVTAIHFTLCPADRGPGTWFVCVLCEFFMVFFNAFFGLIYARFSLNSTFVRRLVQFVDNCDRRQQECPSGFVWRLVSNRQKPHLPEQTFS